MPNESKADQPKHNANWLTIVTAVLAVVSALGVAFLGFQSKSVESGVKLEEISVQKGEVVLQQSKFDADEKKRYEETMSNLIPKILSKDEQEAKVGMAMLFVLFPDRAKEILESAKSALTDSQNAALTERLEPAQQRAAKLEDATGEWIIVVGGDKTLDDAKTEVQRATRAGFSPTLFLKEGWYRTTVGPYPARSDADRANIAVRATLRSGAYVINLKSWCPGQASRNGYVECAAN